MTGPFVLDASMTLSWAFEGESTPFTVAVLKSLETVHAVAPALWAFEVASVLSTAEVWRRGEVKFVFAWRSDGHAFSGWLSAND